MKSEVTINDFFTINLYIDQLKKYRTREICLTNKSSKINNIKVAEELLSQKPDLDITLNYSISVNYEGSLEKLKARFIEFVKNASDLGINKILLVSGVPKQNITTVEFLSSLNKKDFKEIKIFVVFNPYLKGGDLKVEIDRLNRKLESGLVSGIYLQLGDDLKSLEKSLALIKPRINNLPIYGSIVTSNEYILDKLRKKPWFGVKYSEEFLSSVDSAIAKSRQILEFYQVNQITPLIIKIPYLDTDEVYR